MVTRAKVPALTGVVSNMFFFNRADEPWNNNVWYEYDWEVRGAFPENGWAQIRVRPNRGADFKDAPVNVGTTSDITNSLLHWILIRKDNQYVYDIRRDFDINNYDYTNAAAHGGNSASLVAGGPRIYTTGGEVAHIPESKQLDFSLGITAFDIEWTGPLPTGSYSADFVVDFTRFYGFSGNNLNNSPQWQDEFNFLDYSKWQIANWDFFDTQFTRNNIRFEDGKMMLTASRDDGTRDNSNENLALNGTASQSSTINGGSASRAIDNNTSGVWNQGSVTHTTDAINSWWQVDLRQDADINRIEIFNRTNCCMERLSDFSVSVLDADDKLVWHRFYANPPNPSLTINLDTRGRKVKVNLDGTLSLAEVRVFGTSETAEIDENDEMDEIGESGGNTGNEGTITESCDNGTSITYGNGAITMDGGSFYQIFDINWQEVFNCGWQCGNSQTVNNLASGDYRVFIKDNNYQPICEKVITLSGNTGDGNTGDPDNDGDGVPASEDCNDSDSNLTTIGASCTDGDSNTENDIVQGNCTCAGNAINTGDGNSGNGTDITCGEVAITYGNGTVTFTGLATKDYFFKINDLNNGWAQVGGCSWNCGHQLTVTDLPNNTLLLTVYNDDWSQHCSTEIQMTGSSATENTSNRNAPHLSFTAFQFSRAVELEWLSNSGFKVSNFEVEHSKDGVNFSVLSQFVNKEWSDELEYHQSIDKAPVTGDNYYRVKEIYLDGSSAYTDVQKIHFNIDLEGISVFPNPVQDQLFISLKPYLGKAGIVTLSNHFGQIIQQIDLGVVTEELIQINTAKLLNGLYYLQVDLNNQKTFTKQVKSMNSSSIDLFFGEK